MEWTCINVKKAKGVFIKNARMNGENNLNVKWVVEEIQRLCDAYEIAEAINDDGQIYINKSKANAIKISVKKESYDNENNLSVEIKNGDLLFEGWSENGKYACERSKVSDERWKQVFASVFAQYVEMEFTNETGNLTLNQIEVQGSSDTQEPTNTILYGPPGTGKTYKLKDKTRDIIRDKEYKELMQDKITYKKGESEEESAQVVFCTFHQSFSYEDFIEGMRFGDGGKLEVKDGIFKKLCLCANSDENKDKQFVMIIDEINRGNVSKIFGEIITLIEPDKRIGGDNEIKVTLPYSNDLFGIPQNVHIIGTMNTADRSVVQIDTALRRRFDFEEIGPDYEILSKNIAGISVGEKLKGINQRIEEELGADCLIGHAYFINAKSEDELIKVFQKKIIPLLQEYFYDEYKKIGEILYGNNFKDAEERFVEKASGNRYVINKGAGIEAIKAILKEVDDSGNE